MGLARRHFDVDKHAAHQYGLIRFDIHTIETEVANPGWLIHELHTVQSHLQFNSIASRIAVLHQ